MIPARSKTKTTAEIFGKWIKTDHSSSGNKWSKTHASRNNRWNHENWKKSRHSIANRMKPNCMHIKDFTCPQREFATAKSVALPMTIDENNRNFLKKWAIPLVSCFSVSLMQPTNLCIACRQDAWSGVYKLEYLNRWRLHRPEDIKAKQGLVRKAPPLVWFPKASF